MYICEYIYIYIQKKKGGDRMFDLVKVREWTKEKIIGKKSKSLQREEERRNLEAQLTTHRHTQTGSGARPTLTRAGHLAAARWS